MAFCPDCGAEVVESAKFCPACGRQVKTEADRPEDTSGKGALAVVPSEIGGWNWGAFLLSWIWGLCNNVYISLLALIPYFNIIFIFILGAKGNEWAWRNRKWESVEHFKRVQRTWALWGVGLLLFVVALTILLVVVAVAASA